MFKFALNPTGIVGNVALLSVILPRIDRGHTAS